MNGVLNVYKEKGYTSFDVVAKLRGICGERRVGHAGTLDPEAEGVLLVAIGRATKAIDDLSDGVKTYEALMRLGVTTDTQDMTGNIVSQQAPTVTKEQLLRALHTFDGEYDQTPPMYSAVHVNGKRLYELARAGKTIERKPRRVHIYQVKLLETLENESGHIESARFSLTCSKGTYVRTFIADVGEVLGCGAAMSALKRTRVGTYDVKDSVKLSALQEAKDNGTLEQMLLPTADVYKGLPDIHADSQWDRQLRNGGKLPASVLEEGKFEPKPVEVSRERTAQEKAPEPAAARPARTRQAAVARPSETSPERFRVFDSAGHFIGIYEKKNNELAPVRMFLLGLV